MRLTVRKINWSASFALDFNKRQKLSSGVNCPQFAVIASRIFFFYLFQADTQTKSFFKSTFC